MVQSMVNNLLIIGNCIGTTDGLIMALSKYSNSMRPFKTYDKLSPDSIDKFLNETYNVRKIFGKVTMKY